MENEESENFQILNIDDEEVEKELQCSVCQSVLYQPVTLPCGHSFCKECVIVSLKYKPLCPMCRAPTFV